MQKETEHVDLEFGRDKDGDLRIMQVVGNHPENWFLLNKDEENRLINFIKKENMPTEVTVTSNYSVVADLLRVLGILFVVLLFLLGVLGKVDLNGKTIHKGPFFKDQIVNEVKV